MSKRDRDNQDNQDKNNQQNKVYITSEDLICPITREIFNRPVLANDGFTYEEWAIKKCLNEESVSPMTREPLNSYQANKFIKGLVNKLLDSKPELKEEQFLSDVYYDYLQNKEHCNELLLQQRFIELTNIKDIRLQELTNKGYFIEFLSKRCTNTEIFKKILMNAFDLNCKNTKKLTPMYYIASDCNKDIILMAIELGAEIHSISSGPISTNIFRIIDSNTELTDEDKEEIIEYIFNNNLMIKAFIDDPKILITFSDHDRQFNKLIDKIIEHPCAIYKLIDIGFLVDMINSDVPFDKLSYILHNINNQMIEVNKIKEHYKIHKSEYFLNERIFDVYDCINDRTDLIDENKKVLSRGFKTLFDKMNIDEIDDYILNCDIEDQKNDIREGKLNTINKFNEIINL